MSYCEQALTFGCGGEQLLGVLSLPERPHAVAVVVIVGGPQYRIGSHRQFVHLARRLAAHGYVVLRFDYRGMGDSSGALHDFLQVDDDIASAITALRQTVPTVKQVVLWGLCDGASAALMYVDATADPVVAGLCLLNPWVRSDTSQARTRLKHYYVQRLLQPAFWHKLLRGQVARDAVAGLWQSVRRATDRSALSHPQSAARLAYQQAMAQGWCRMKGRILLILSADDHTAKEFMEYVSADAMWRQALEAAPAERHGLDQADHTLSDQAARIRAEDLTLSWLTRLAGSRPL